jgi:hypothetical protein
MEMPRSFSSLSRSRIFRSSGFGWRIFLGLREVGNQKIGLVDGSQVENEPVFVDTSNDGRNGAAKHLGYLFRAPAAARNRDALARQFRGGKRTTADLTSGID